MSWFKIHPQRNKIVEAQESPTVKDNSIEHLEERMIHKVLLPLTVSMRILALYFEKTDKQRMIQQCSRFYCLFIVVIMWLNAIRIFTVFTGRDKLRALLGNIANVIIMVSGAVIRTACYRNSMEGRIPEILQTFDKDMNARWAKHLRVRVVFWVLIAWVSTAFVVVSTGYALFNENGFLTILIAPFNSIILHSSQLTLKALSGLVIVLTFYIAGGAIFSLIWNYFFSAAISNEFKKCTKMLQNIVKDPEAAKRNLEMVRSHHQKLCRMVDRVDGQVCINNAIFVVGFIFVAILNIYSLLCVPNDVMRGSPFQLLSSLLWILFSVFGLITVARGGIMINKSAHKIYERIHNMDLTNLNAETIGQINTFLNRLCGEPIGFTVLRIFVIDRNTILTILGLLVTYFLLIVQMYPPSPDNQWNYLLSEKVSTSEPPPIYAVNNATTSFS